MNFFAFSFIFAAPSTAVGIELQLDELSFDAEANKAAMPIRLDVETYFREAEQTCDAIYSGVRSDASVQRPWQWHLLPDGLLWHSYLAAPQEPRISTVIFRDTNAGIFWDATLGGRVGLMRYGTSGAHRPQGWQWDLEGAVITRLDLLHAEDVESMDYRFGSEITTAEGPWSAKIGYFHVSSHVGDEYVIRNPTFIRTNYVTESVILGLSYRPDEELRLYGESAYAFHASDGADRWQFQTGLEYTAVEKAPCRGAPFTAVNLDFREAVNFDLALTLQTGWAWQGSESDRRFRVGLQYAHGPTSQFEFFQRREEYLGVGCWFDY